MSAAKLARLTDRWSSARAAERANFQSYIIELCEALEVERPRPAGSGYEFEYPVRVINRDGTEATNFIDLYKRNHFVLEAKDQGSPESDSLLLRKAYGQARAYAAAVDGNAPPYVLVLTSVGRSSYGTDGMARTVDSAPHAESVSRRSRSPRKTGRSSATSSRIRARATRAPMLRG